MGCVVDSGVLHSSGTIYSSIFIFSFELEALLLFRAASNTKLQIVSATCAHIAVSALHPAQSFLSDRKSPLLDKGGRDNQFKVTPYSIEAQLDEVARS